MRILFAGCPDISVPSLERCNTFFSVVGVLTNPDTLVGRGRSKQKSPVKATAEKLGLTTIESFTLDSSVRKKIKARRPDVLVVVAFGKIFDKAFLDLFSRGAVNLHPSLLPRYRGPSPIPAAILNGDKKTGITIQRVGLKMDSGDILAREEIPLDGNETTEDITGIAAEKGSHMMVDVLKRIDSGKEEAVRQKESEASYCKLIRQRDAFISWEETAEIINRKVRAYYPWPVAHTFWKGKRLNIIEAYPYGECDGPSYGNEKPGKVLGVDKNAGILVQTKGGVLAVKRLQLQSRKQMDWKAFINGVHGFTDSVLGE